MAALLAMAVSGQAEDGLYARFLKPDDDCRTKLWWFHGETETTKEGIRMDLEEFKDKGIGGVVFYDQVHGKAADALPSMSPEWWEMLKYAAKTAKELGLSFEMAVGNGYVAGGPWITTDLAMKKTAVIDTLVNFRKNNQISIAPGLKDFHDVATIIWRDKEEIAPIILNLPPVSLQPGDSIINIDLGKTETLAGLSYEFTPRGKGSTASMNIPGPPSDRYFAAKYIEYPPIGSLEISSDNENWTKCCALLPIESTIGFKSRRRTVSFPAQSGRYIRLNLHEEKINDESYRPITISDLVLHRRDIIDNPEVKSGLRTEVTYPSPCGDDSGAIPSANIFDVTDSIRDDGTLHITMPEGTWRILRFGYVPTGAKTKHGRKNLLGYEADVMSAEAANIHYNNYFKTVLDTLSSIGCPPKGMCMDSHEAGCQNWTQGLEGRFSNRYGYDLIPYLAAMAGYIVDSREKSEDALHDFRRLVAETISSEYYGTFAKRCREDGVDFTSQSMLNILTDNIANRGNASKPQGEFWAYQKNGNYDCLDAASAAHIYGHNIVSGEAFTDTPYEEPFDSLLRIANIAYSRGINEFAVCASSYQPWPDHKYEDSSTLHPYVFHRHNPQWAESRPFWDYQARCATMLREGNPVVDLAIYIGEEPPLKTFAFKLPEMPHGYNFDVFSIDALKKSMQPSNGEVLTDGGMRYKAIAVEDKISISDEARKKLEDFQQSGVPVIWCDKGESVRDILNEACIKPDIDADRQLHFFHRTTSDKEIYFVYNHFDSPFDGSVSFRSLKDRTELWNPNDGSKKEIDSSKGNINLHLDPWEAVFIVSQ